MTDVEATPKTADRAADTGNVDDGPNADYKKDPKLDDNGNPLPKDDKDASQGKDSTAEDGTTEDDKAKAEEEGDKAGEKTDLSSTPNDKIVDYKEAKHVEGLLTQAGLDAKAVALQISENGGTIPTDLAKSLRDKHGEAVAELIEDKLKGFYKSTIDVVHAREKAIFDQVQEAFKGATEQKGEDTWTELATWAKANMEAKERKELNGMLEKGGMSAKMAVEHLVAQFKNSEGFSQEASLVGGDNLSQDYGVKTIDKAGYDRELRKLLDAGHNYDTSPEIAQLDKRRLKSINRGM